MTVEELDLIDKRLERLEDGFNSLTTSLAHMSGQQQSILDKLNTPPPPSVFNKLLIGTIVVNSLLHGAVTPEVARDTIQQLLSTAAVGGH